MYGMIKIPRIKDGFVMENERILVVDDDRDIVATLKIQLEKEGFSVLCAYDGEEALDVLTQNKVHLILLDIICLLYTSPSPRD